MDGWKGKTMVSLRKLTREAGTPLEDPRNYL